MTIKPVGPIEAGPSRHARLDPELAETALDRAVEHLLAQQHDEGWWRGLLQTNVTMEAEDLMMRQFLGVRTEEQTEQTARWVRSHQRPDGSWANFPGGPADPSTTTEAYVALRLAGDDPGEPHMLAARRVVLAHGGLARTRVFTRIWLALFGLWEWESLPALPPELIFLPRWMPLNLYDFACWARQTVAPLTILAALRPQRDLGVRIDELHDLASLRAAEQATQKRGWRRTFEVLDTALHAYERHQLKPGRESALRRTAEWIVARQEADGSWGGIQPPWVYSLMALHALGYPLEHPVMERGLRGWERFTVIEQTPCGPARWIEACQSPVWDTALATIALSDAGLDAEHPAMAAASEWLADQEITVCGDWAVRRPDAPAGGWAFEFDNDGYPDLDDTAEVVMALRRAGRSATTSTAADRGVAWLLGMQCRDGSWAAFDADNTRELAYQLPFCDFGAVTDPPSADVTAHVVEMLVAEGLGEAQAVRRGVAWLLSTQERDGSWYGRWGANHVYGTGAVVPALVRAGLSPDDPVVDRATDWLARQQNSDGGWGEDLRSYDDSSWVGKGDSTPSQTAWALLALHAAGLADGSVAQAGIGWLVDNQRADGGWDEPQFTGTGFPGDFYIGYHLYRLVFPVSALGRCLRRSPW